ncbi:MAG: hypothetical protein KDA91_14840 [Planctomycetaceae bacterium]|nr:hypothetical protein [Planctomycetaceae bacterium]
MDSRISSDEILALKEFATGVVLDAHTIISGRLRAAATSDASMRRELHLAALMARSVTGATHALFRDGEIWSILQHCVPRQKPLTRPVVPSPVPCCFEVIVDCKAFAQNVSDVCGGVLDSTCNEPSIEQFEKLGNLCRSFQWNPWQVIQHIEFETAWLFHAFCGHPVPETSPTEAVPRQSALAEDRPEANCGAPQFKKDPPFGPRVSEDVKACVRAFMAEYVKDLDVDAWCRNYAEKRVQRPDWNCRKIVYDYVKMPE